MGVQNNFWDKKSKTYNKFDGKLNEFQERFFKVLDKFGVDFEGKTLIDIGCGTGVYTLYLATLCKSVLGIDSSEGMLYELNLNLYDLDYLNVETKLVSFDEFETDRKFDIAFLTMSPALKTEADYEKFLNLANLRVYMNWEEKRSSSLVDPFFKKYGYDNLNRNRAIYLQEYLDNNAISYKTEILTETRIAKRSFEEAFENACWHLEISGLKFNKNEVKENIKSRLKDGYIDDVIKSKMRVLVF
ncbi:MAG: methyltransferase domain-containing protein [Campylobacteraceae bacterium]|nr:methyltransferase domain-containing protein [Campylobacteraceae bacterium]